MKLDPVAEVFLYDIVFRNRSNLPRDQIENRTTYGHKFNQGAVVSIGASYREFRAEALRASQQYEFTLVCDVSSFFNSVYHHDIEHFYREHWNGDDTDHLGLFLRQANEQKKAKL